MAYNQELAGRIRALVAGAPGMTELKMFGGIAFMDRGNMCCGVVGEELMVRVRPDAHQEFLSLPGARLMDFNGRASKGMVFVGEAGIGSDDGLSGWVARGLAFTGGLPAKDRAVAPKRRARPVQRG